jgi:N-acetylmuramoyl-L-alanine amidase
MRHIDEIIVHCTATNRNWFIDRDAHEVVEEVRRWHKEERGWSDIGYHFVIHRSGQIAAGRPITRNGAHTRGHNKGTIGIALVGGRGGAADDDFLDNFTPEQHRELHALIDSLKEEFPTITKVSAHNMYAKKACPCFDVRQWLSE